jgi:hypothetical protein
LAHEIAEYFLAIARKIEISFKFGKKIVVSKITNFQREISFHYN